MAQEVVANVDPNHNDLQEVCNYMAALEYGLESSKSFPLSLQLTKEVHWKLMQSIRGSDATPVEFRHVQN